MPTESRSTTAIHRIVLTCVAAFLFALGGRWDDSGNVDSVAAALPAWSLATQGDIWIDEPEFENPWLVNAGDHETTNRPLGVFLVAVPAYFLAPSNDYSNAPATITALTLTLAALWTLHVVLTQLVGLGAATLATAVTAFGTPTWAISSAQLWPHGPGQLAAALSLLALSSASLAAAGWAYSAGIVIRPITAIFPFIVGIRESIIARDIRPAVKIGIPSALGLGVIVAYNWILFGTPNVSGGYGTQFSDRVVTGPSQGHLRNLWDMFFSQSNGIFVWSPIALVGLLGISAVWKQAPQWTRSAFLAGVVYLVVHARLNRASGGIGHGYRYPLEPLIMMTPTYTLAVIALWRRSPIMRFIVVTGIAASVLFGTILATYIACRTANPSLLLCLGAGG